MHFHDFHIAGYSISDFGGTIVLDLVYDYPNQPKIESHIKFSEVAAYHFVHTGGAIMTDIEEVSLENLLERVGDSLAERWRQHGGYIHWRDDRSEYRVILEKEGYRAWFLDSAIGFEGFVIAKTVGELPV
jgi:hypothetical protein